MSDFDPDAYLTQSGPQATAFDPDAYLTQSPVAPAPLNGRLMTAGEAEIAAKHPELAPGYTGSGGTGAAIQAAGSGVNSGAMDLLGLPMDALTNAANLGLAGVESGVLATGHIPPKWLDPANPETVPGTSEWLKKQTRNLGGSSLIDATTDTPDTRTIHTMGEIAGPGAAADVGALAPDAITAAARTVKPSIARAAQDVVDKTVAESAQSMGAAKAAPNVAGATPPLQKAIVQAAQQTGGAVPPNILARHLEADSLPVPISLTEGQASQDPTIISNERNSRGAQPILAQRFNQQNTQLIQNLQALRDKIGPDVFSANPVEHGDTLIQAYKDKADAADAITDAKYKALRDANGGSFPVDAPQLLSNVTNQLHQQLLYEHAPKELGQLQTLAEKNNMTFEQFEAMRTNLARTMRSSTDGNEVAAAKTIRNQMEQIPLQAQAANLKPLADSARAAARTQFQALEADPAYNAAVNDKITPDKFVQKFIVAAPRDDVATMRANLAHDPTATQTMGAATIDHLAKQSLGTDLPNAFEVDDLGNVTAKANFSQAAFNKHLLAMQPKLGSLVDSNTADTLEKIGNVARNVQFQPSGSSVNNSNTLVAALASHAANLAEGAGNLLGGKVIPMGSLVRGAVQKRAATKAAERSLAPGAGLTRLSDVVNNP